MLFGLVDGRLHEDDCEVEIVERGLLLFTCLELQRPLDIFDADEATELAEDILDNVESVETGDIVDVLPKPAPLTPPKKYSMKVTLNIERQSYIGKIKINSIF